MPLSTSIRALTFDCYGTLIDWEAGILKALRPVLSIHGISRERADDAEILRLYSRFEPEIQAAAQGGSDPAGHVLYRDVLREVVARFGEHFSIRLAERELDRLPDSIAHWPAFSDTPAALARLASKYTLAVVSNIDDELFAGTLPHLHGGHAAADGEPREWPSWVVTAQYCRSYKPNPRHFRVALALLGLEPSRVLHVAQSRFHDIGPARALGFRTAWINRRSLLPGTGATPAAEARADVEYPDLKSLADALGV